jgi:hypothetical protein
VCDETACAWVAGGVPRAEGDAVREGVAGLSAGSEGMGASEKVRMRWSRDVRRQRGITTLVDDDAAGFGLREERRPLNGRLSEVLTTLIVVVGVTISLGFVARGIMENTRKSRDIRIAKIEACKTIDDEAIRALCVVEGGAAEPGGN